MSFIKFGFLGLLMAGVGVAFAGDEGHHLTQAWDQIKVNRFQAAMSEVKAWGVSLAVNDIGAGDQEQIIEASVSELSLPVAKVFRLVQSVLGEKVNVGGETTEVAQNAVTHVMTVTLTQEAKSEDDAKDPLSPFLLGCEGKPGLTKEACARAYANEEQPTIMFAK